MIIRPDQALAAASRQDFLTFLEVAFRILCPGDTFTPGWHLQAIDFRLKQVATRDVSRLLVTMPPRSLKSITISVAWVAWMLGRNPALRFVCASYSMDLSLKLARDCRALIESPQYRRIFPGLALVRRAEGDLQTRQGGGRFSTSVGGTLTGRGGDFLIIDDPINPQDAYSEAERRTAKEWFTGTATTRLNNKLTGAVIMVMQRLHQDDLAGHVLEAGGYSHLSLPAIAEVGETIQLQNNVFRFREPGDLLQPEREPLSVLDQARRDMGGAAFAAQYQQNPTTLDGNYVRRAWLRSYPRPFVRLDGDLVIQAWDCAIKTGDGHDYSVCVTAVERRGRIYVIDVFRDRLAFPDLRRAVETLAIDYGAKVLLIEDAASGAQLIQQLENDRPHGVPSPIACKPDQDKITRLAACTPAMEAGDLVLPEEAPWKDDFTAELLGFPNSRHDDQVDAVVHLMAWVANRPRVRIEGPGVWLGPSRPSPWGDESLGLGHGALC